MRRANTRVYPLWKRLVFLAVSGLIAAIAGSQLVRAATHGVISHRAHQDTALATDPVGFWVAVILWGLTSVLCGSLAVTCAVVIVASFFPSHSRLPAKVEAHFSATPEPRRASLDPTA